MDLKQAQDSIKSFLDNDMTLQKSVPAIHTDATGVSISIRDADGQYSSIPGSKKSYPEFDDSLEKKSCPSPIAKRAPYTD